MNPRRQTIHFDKKLIDKDALKVLKQIHKAKFEAYLVGGCIRDLLLGKYLKILILQQTQHLNRFINYLNDQGLLVDGSQ